MPLQHTMLTTGRTLWQLNPCSGIRISKQLHDICTRQLNLYSNLKTLLITYAKNISNRRNNADVGGGIYRKIQTPLYRSKGDSGHRAL
ncbi:MAG: hypothetical protein U5L45_24050 [Saprospiraceae bacterium]|nr:hypothetical protein [Saprospiraceae bacterium]